LVKNKISPILSVLFDLFDKALHSVVGTIGGLFLLVKGYFARIIFLDIPPFFLYRLP